MPSSSYHETELLILEIRKRPTIWNSNVDDYKNKNKKRDAWAEVCTALNPQYDEKSDTQKQQILHDIQSRWKSIRDSNHRCQKKLKQVKRKSGSEANNFKKYLFADHLNFLQKKKMKRESDDSLELESNPQDESLTHDEEEDEDEEMLAGNLSLISPWSASSSTQQQQNNNSIKTGHTRNRTLEQKLITFMDRCEEKDEDKDFFNSLLSSVRNLTEDQKLMFRSEVIMALRRVKSGGSEGPPGSSGNKPLCPSIP